MPLVLQFQCCTSSTRQHQDIYSRCSWRIDGAVTSLGPLGSADTLLLRHHMIRPFSANKLEEHSAFSGRVTPLVLCVVVVAVVGEGLSLWLWARYYRLKGKKKKKRTAPLRSLPGRPRSTSPQRFRHLRRKAGRQTAERQSNGGGRVRGDVGKGEEEWEDLDKGYGRR